MITIELSTIIPKTTIKAAKVTVFSSIPINLNIPIDMNTVIGIVDAATSATLIGSKSITTITTATIAIKSSPKKLVTDSFTNSL